MLADVAIRRSPRMNTLTPRTASPQRRRMKRLEGKVAVITGATRGVGKAIALTFAREGADIVIAAKTAEPNPALPGTIYDTAKEIEALGRRALPLKVNVREEDDIDRMAAETARAFGRVDILINNAGAIHLASIEDTPAKKFDLVMDVNARASYLCTRAVLPYMKDGGHVVMMSPPIHPKKIAGKVAYGLSKVGMSIIAIGLAEELRERRISVNALWPVTAVESQATIHFQMGKPQDWRKADIMADATLELVCTPPGERTGLTLYDEDVLGWIGVTNFDHYALVPGAKPGPFSKMIFE